jgi:GTP-dependent phosphoenolpyruvate carboxykinase
MDEENYSKLMKINNPDLHKFITKYVELCNPKSVFVNTNSEEDVQYIRDATIIQFTQMGIRIKLEIRRILNSYCLREKISDLRSMRWIEKRV